MRPDGRIRVLKNGLSFGQVVRESRYENVESPCDHSEPIFCLPMMYIMSLVGHPTRLRWSGGSCVSVPVAEGFQLASDWGLNVTVSGPKGTIFSRFFCSEAAVWCA